MRRFRDPADPSRIEDDDPSEEQQNPRQKRSSSRTYSRPRREFKSPQRPAEVSATIWGLAEQWIEDVEAAIGQRPYVNLEEFAKRFSARVRHDPEVVRFLQPRKFNPDSGRVEHLRLSDEEREQRHDEVEQTIAVMIEIFCEKEIGPGTSPMAVQHQFLDDFEDLLERARDLRRIEKWRAAGGKTVPVPEYPRRDESDYHQAIAQIRLDASVDRALASTAEPVQVRTGKRLRVPKRNREAVAFDPKEGPHHHDA